MKIVLFAMLVAVMVSAALAAPRTEKAWPRPPLDALNRMAKKSIGKNCDMESEWPWAWMEFAQFMGRCHTTDLMFTELDIYYEESMMKYICEFASGIYSIVEMGTDEQKKEYEFLLEDIFHIIQCMNMMTMNETYWRMNEYFGITAVDAGFYTEMRPLFDVCYWAFGNAETEIETFYERLMEIFYGTTQYTRSIKQLDVTKLGRPFRKCKPVYFMVEIHIFE